MKKPEMMTNMPAAPSKDHTDTSLGIERIFGLLKTAHQKPMSLKDIDDAIGQAVDKENK